MNIGLISREYPPETGWGGIGTYTYHLAQALVEQGQAVHVICQGLEREKDYFDQGVHVHRIMHRNILEHKYFLTEFTLRLEYSLAVCRKVKELIKKFAIEIIEGPNSSGEAFFILWGRKGIPLVTRLHTAFWETIECRGWKSSLDLKLSCLIEDKVITSSNLVTCSTKNHARIISEKLGINPDEVALIPLGTQLPDLNTVKQLYADKAPFSKPMVLFMGRLEQRKGIHTLIKAVPAIIEQVPQAQFVIIGRDTYTDDNKASFRGDSTNSFKYKFVSQLPEKYQHNVHFLGYVEPEFIPQYLYHCDVFVAPSLYESFGQVYIEAMSYAKPVVGCCVGGVPEVVEHDKTGLLIKPDNPEELTKAVIKMLKDKQMSLTMGEAGRSLTETKFTRDIMAKNTIEAYKSILNKTKL